MSQTSSAAIPSGTLVASPEITHPRPLIQSVPADFYSLADDDGRPIAGLIVLNDSGRRPVRAELHLVGVSTDETGRNAIRQAQRLLEDRYRGPDALPMQVWQSFLRSDPLEVPLPPPVATDKPAKSDKSKAATSAAPVKTKQVSASPSTSAISNATATGRAALNSMSALPWKWIGIATGALLVLMMLWGIVNWFRGDSPADVTVPNGGGISAPAADTQAATAAGAAASDPSLENPVDTSVSIAPVVAESLAVSRNADANILVGKHVKVKPNVEAMALRSEPGASAGEIVGYLKGDEEANVIGGPKSMRGDSDTIVWWQVQLDDGTQAWAAANTSTMQLLEAME